MVKRLRAGLLAACGLALAQASPAQAETISLFGTAPAASDAAAAQHSIAVERFGGQDGARLSFLIEGRLRDAYVTPEPWFTVLVPELAGEADAVLQGFAEPQLIESEYIGTREICIARDDKKNCTQHSEVETECLRLSASLRPSLRLISREGEVLWSDEPAHGQDFSWCPQFDGAPALDPVIDGWLDRTASQVRLALAPHNWSRNVRIMERSGGIARSQRRAFRDAIRLVERDRDSACDTFVQLLADNPEQPSLTFNVGLCAEARGDYALAFDQYRAALAYGNSDDEGRAGLDRLATRDRAERQLASRFP